MRILHVTDCYLPRLGGIEMHVSDLASRQQAAGHDVTVLTRSPGTGNGPVPVRRLRGGPLTWGRGAEVNRFVEDSGIDVVHAHLSVASPLSSAALRSVRDVATVATIHSVVPDAPELLRSAMAITRFPTSTVAFTAVSEAAAAPWRRALGDRMPVRVLHNGIDPYDWATERMPSDDSTFTVVSVGRFARRKRRRALVDMLAALRLRLPAATVLRAVLVGDGPELPAVRHDIGRAGLTEHVDLPGRLTRTQIRAVLAEADVYAAPAILESFGIAALEARCAGLPVVAMSRGGASEFVQHGQEGFLVRTDAEMVEALLKLSTDRELRDRISHHNATTVPPMAWVSVLAQHEQVYMRALTRDRRPESIRRLGSVVHSS